MTDRTKWIIGGASAPVRWAPRFKSDQSDMRLEDFETAMATHAWGSLYENWELRNDQMIRLVPRLRRPIEVMSPDLFTRGRWLVELDPVIHELRHNLREFGELDRLSNIAVRAEAVTVDEVLFFN